MASERGAAETKKKGQTAERGARRRIFWPEEFAVFPCRDQGIVRQWGHGNQAQPNASRTQFKYLAYPILTRGNSKFHPRGPQKTENGDKTTEEIN